MNYSSVDRGWTQKWSRKWDCKNDHKMWSHFRSWLPYPESSPQGVTQLEIRIITWKYLLADSASHDNRILVMLEKKCVASFHGVGKKIKRLYKYCKWLISAGWMWWYIKAWYTSPNTPLLIIIMNIWLRDDYSLKP